MRLNERDFGVESQGLIRGENSDGRSARPVDGDHLAVRSDTVVLIAVIGCDSSAHHFGRACEVLEGIVNESLVLVGGFNHLDDLFDVSVICLINRVVGSL